jgi:hypothetical protein
MDPGHVLWKSNGGKISLYVFNFSQKLWKSETISKRNIYKDDILKHLVLGSR